MSESRLLAGTASGPLRLAQHLEVHGHPRGGAGLIDSVERCALRGRGGASFPTAVKMRAAARHRGPRTVLVNAAEGEPLSRKDRVLLELAPHLVLDGAVAAAQAIGAGEIVVAIREDAVLAIEAVTRAAGERGLSRRKCRITTVPPAYLAGQESALINYLEGRAMRPSTVPPLPVERGLGRRPTLVQNPETLAQVALIDRGQTPTTALVTLGGAVAIPGVYEVEDGATVGALLDASGGDAEHVQAVLVGGFHGVWHRSADAAAVPLDDRTRAAGVLFVLDKRACAVMEIVRVVRWLAQESAGQCGPCANGMPAIAQLLERSITQKPPPQASAQLERWSVDVTGRGACHLPDGAMRFLRTGLDVFAAEFAHHFRHGRCPRCAEPSRLLPAAAYARERRAA